MADRAAGGVHDGVHHRLRHHLDRNDRALFGYKMYIVRSDSMSATDFKAGDLILVRSVDPATLQEGDIIA